MKILDPQTFWDSVPTEASPAWPGICLDFNGVFDQYKGYSGVWEDFPPAEGIEEFLITLNQYFRTIVVLTATMPLDPVIAWLDKNNLSQYIHYITNHKPPAHVYVDDRAVTHRGNFNETLSEILTFVPHWKTKNE